MKVSLVWLGLCLMLGMACSYSGKPQPTAAAPLQQTPQVPAAQNRKHCGDGVCDGPENAKSCPQDCSPSASGTQNAQPNPSLPPAAQPQQGGEVILFQIVEHEVHRFNNCNQFNMRQYLDGGYVQRDGGSSRILKLQGHPTSMLTAEKMDRYYYISSEQNPVGESAGFPTFNWDVAGQALWTADFAANTPQALTTPGAESFPGDVASAPRNRFVLYPLTLPTSSAPGQQPGMLFSSKFDPFASDSSLVIFNPASGTHTAILANAYNRALFSSFGDFSADGSAFYTISLSGGGFQLVKISLENGTVSAFDSVFPAFNWKALNWNEFFSTNTGLATAHFRISPDEKRLVAYRAVFSASSTPATPCALSGSYHLWVFHLDDGRLEEYRNQPGVVADADWKSDSSAFALAIVDNTGCYPEYLNSHIALFDPQGTMLTELVSEPRSKITHILWSPQSDALGYDVYSTDYVGRIKLVNASNKSVSEVINTDSLRYAPNLQNPVTLSLAGWMKAGGMP
ncbi:MAG: hypothetical protein HPY45_13880 [Anaerolineae bacterium]|nr:hypothetical protein [Anaerolineae bacterium]